LSKRDPRRFSVLSAIKFRFTSKLPVSITREYYTV
jgi:hypothetical protein